jgi:hypothetical protein
MKRKSLLALLTILSLITWSCIDEISLDIDNDHRQLVVDGLISDSLAVYTIRVNYSAVLGVGTDNVFDPVSGATVEVHDDAGNVLTFPETAQGVYQNTMQGQAGRSYFVRVVLPEGREIRSKPAALPRAPEIDSITAEIRDESYLNPAGNVIVENRLLLNMHTRFDNFDDKPFLRWRVEGEYEFKENYPMAINTRICYVKNNVDLNNLKLFDVGALGGDNITDEPILNTLLDYRFAYQYCFHVTQYAITQEEYTYWAAVNDIINIDGSLFDPPPGTVRGNLYDTQDPDAVISGYFSVNGSHRVRYFANPQSLNQIYIEPRCRASRFGPQYSECANCTMIHGSSLERPEYWEP